MRVAHLVEGLDAIGGVPTYLAGLLPALRSRGVDNVLVTAQPGDAFAGTRRVDARAIGSDRSVLDRREREELVRVLAAEHVDVAYAHVTRNPAVLDAVGGVAPVVFYAHDYYAVCPGSMRYLERSMRFCSEGPGLHCFWRAYTERTASRRPDRLARSYARVRAWRATWPGLARVLVASPFVADALESDGVRREIIRVVPYFVEPVPRAAAPRGLDVLFLGRLLTAKGAQVLVKALAQLDGVHAVVAGDGPDRERTERLARDLGISSRVRFTGWIDAGERRALLASARLVVVPSLWDEPFGIAGIEALAAGVPVVASDVGGISSWLDHDVCGLLVPRGNPGALAEAMARVLGDAETYDRFAAAAPAVAARFSVERHLELLLPELEAAAAG